MKETPKRVRKRLEVREEAVRGWIGRWRRKSEDLKRGSKKRHEVRKMRRKKIEKIMAKRRAPSVRRKEVRL